MREDYEIKNCKRNWDKVDVNKQHCKYLCNGGICDNVYCNWNWNLNNRKDK